MFGGPDDCYRYRLERAYPTYHRTVMWLMMNPSGADPLLDDRTIRRCWTFTICWGFGRMLVANADTYRCTDQRRLVEVADPCGPDNVRHILEMAREANVIVAAYGKPKVKAVQDHGLRAVHELVRHGHDVHVLELAQDGTPKHPLYLGGDRRPVVWLQRLGHPV